MGKSCAGIEIGGTKLQIVAGEVSGKIHDRVRLEINPSEGAEAIRRAIKAGLTEIISKWAPIAIGVGFGGPVDTAKGEVCCSHQIEGWSKFPLGAWLREFTALPVRIDNDANTAALGEATLGAGSGFDPVFYVTLGSGVGGGLVTGGSIYHGALPGEAEIGHLRLDRSGTTVESRCSGWVIDARIRERIRLNPKSMLGELIGGQVGGEAKFLAAAIHGRDPAALEILEELACNLAFALSHVTHLFHPEVIILGGGLSLVGEVFREAVQRALRPLIMNAFAPGPAVRLASLAEDAVPIGALLLTQFALG